MSGGALCVEPDRQGADVMAKRGALRCRRTLRANRTSYTLPDFLVNTKGMPVSGLLGI